MSNAYVPPIAVLPYTPAIPADWTPPPTNGAEALDQLAARVTTLVQVQGSSNGGDVGVNVTQTPIGVAVGVTVDGTQIVEVSAIASFKNASAGLAAGADVTLALLVDSAPFGPPASLDQFAAGESACTTALLAGPAVLAAGAHAVLLVATASSGAANCVIPAGLGRIIVRRYG